MRSVIKYPAFAVMVGIVLSTVFWNASSISALEIARDGQAVCRIVLPIEPTPVETTAAKELAAFLKQITGGEFTILAENQIQSSPQPTIYVGKTARAMAKVNCDKFAYDEIYLCSEGADALILAGHRQRGALYAVYTFLEDYLGVRFWTQKDTFVPVQRSVTVDKIEHRFAPKMEYREAFYRVGFNGVFAARSKCNGNAENVADEYGGHHRFLYFVHSFGQLIPIEKYYSEHPDWFPEINGVRKVGHPGWASQSDERKAYMSTLKPEQIHTSGTQLCLANDEMRAELTKNALVALRNNPKANIISISQNDWHGYCTCEKCRALDEAEGSPAGSLITFVNKVAEDIEKEFPDVWVETLAYQYTRKPPKTVKPRNNVIVRLCTIECSFLKPLSDPVNETLKNDIEGWSKISPQLFVWDYVTNFSFYLMPHPNMQVLAPNIRFFCDNKTIGLFEQGDYHTTVGDFVHARHWVIAKLLWNPYQDQQPLWDEFFSGYYGPAGPILQEYLTFIHDKAIASDVYLRCFMQKTNDWLSDDDMNESALIVARAREAVKDDPVLSRRVDIALLSYDLNWLQRYNNLKLSMKIADKPFYGPADPIAKAEALFKLAEEEGTFQYREHGGRSVWDEFKHDVFGQLSINRAKKPDLSIDWDKALWLDIQDSAINLSGQELNWGTKDTDPAASDGRTIRMSGDHYEWATSWRFPLSISTKKKWHIYAAVRCEATAEQGRALQWGIYDTVNRKGIASKDLAVPEINGSEYKLIDYGVHENLNSGMYLWFAPPKRPGEVQNVYIDRVVLIAE